MACSEGGGAVSETAGGGAAAAASDLALSSLPWRTLRGAGVTSSSSADVTTLGSEPWPMSAPKFTRGAESLPLPPTLLIANSEAEMMKDSVSAISPMPCVTPDESADVVFGWW